jgi:hypothetical protein
MKRFILPALLLAALMVLPASALAKRGDHKVHRNHGQVGTITSFDSSTGELVITTAKGRAISALVTDDTHIQCRHDDDADDSTDDNTATVSRHGDDDEDGDDDDHGGRGDDDGDDDDHGDDHGHHGHHGHHSSKCSTDDLTEGTAVRRARIDLDGDDAVWTKLKLAS